MLAADSVDETVLVLELEIVLEFVPDTVDDLEVLRVDEVVPDTEGLRLALGDDEELALPD